MKLLKIHIIVLCLSLLICLAAPLPPAFSCFHGAYFESGPREFLPYNISFFPSSLGYDSLVKEYLFTDCFSGQVNCEEPEELQSKLKTINLHEWKAYLGNNLSSSAIEKIVYQATLEELEVVEQKLRKGESLSIKDQFLNYLSNSDLLDILSYIIYAKRCEPFAVLVDPWSTETIAERNPNRMQLLIEEGLNRIEKVKDPFLKLRYGYQIVRLAHYAGLNEECVRYYDRWVAPANSDSYLFYQSMRHKAAALKRLGRIAESLHLLSLVFDQYQPLLRAVCQEFFIPDPEMWEKTLALDLHPHRQATLWFIRFLKQADRLDMEPLRQMVQLEPKSSRTEMMLVQQINKIEKNLVTAEAFFPGYGLSQTNQSYIRDLLELIDGTDKSRLRQPALWQLAAGYMAILLKEYEQADDYFDLAEKSPARNQLIPEVLSMLHQLSQLARTDRITASLESSILPSLQWVLSLKPQYNQTIVQKSLLLLLAQKYLSQGEFAKGFCCYQMAGYKNVINVARNHATADQFAQFVKYLQTDHRSAYDTFLTAQFKKEQDHYYYHLGHKYLAEGKFDEALSSYRQISVSYGVKEYLCTTPFSDSVYDPKTGLNREWSTAINKKDFIKKVIDLLEEAKQYPERAGNYYFQIGNGFFDAGDFYNDGFSNSLVVLSDNLRYPFFDDQRMKSLKHPSPYHEWANPWAKRIIAWSCYDTAMSVTKDPELAAKCCFLAAASQTSFSSHYEFAPPGKDRYYYYRLMEQKYRETKYYQEVIQECATLRNYLGQ